MTQTGPASLHDQPASVRIRRRILLVGAVLGLVAATIPAGALAPTAPRVAADTHESVRVTGTPLRHTFSRSAGEHVDAVWTVSNVGNHASEFDGMLRMDAGASGGSTDLAEALTVAYAEPTTGGESWIPAGTLAHPMSVQAACAQLPAAVCVTRVTPDRPVQLRVRVTLERPELISRADRSTLDATFYAQYAPVN